MSERYSPLYELTLARIREFYREPGAIFWVFVFPVLLAVGLGIAFRNRPPDKAQVVVEQNGHGQWIADALADAPELEMKQRPSREAGEALRLGKADLVLRGNGEQQVVYRFDPTQPNSRTARLLVDIALQKKLGRVDVVTATDQQVTEPGGRYIDFLVPGLIGLNLMGSSMWGIGYTVVLSRKRRQLRRFAATPLRRSTFLLSYLLSRMLFLFFEVAALALFGWWVFDVPVQGSLLSLGLVSILGAACFAGIALLIAARVESLEAVNGWLNFVMLPMWLLSGAFFAYSRFPEVIQPAIRALPLTALNDTLRGIMLQGTGLADYGLELMVLLAWGGLSFVIALKTFRWQ